MVADPDVVDIRADRQGQIGQQRPRRGGPGEEVEPLVTIRGEADRDRWVLHVLIVQIGFEVGQHGAEPRGERQHLVALIDQVLVPQLLEHPPDRFHERGVHGPVGVAEIDPAARPLDGLFPLPGVAQDDLAALVVELGDPETLDGGFSAHAQRLLDLHFDRQAVAVPAEAAVHVAAAHGPEAGNDVLDRAGQQMPVVRQAGGERRPVVENERRPVTGLVQRLLEDAPLVPGAQDVELDVDQLHVVGNRLHAVRPRGTPPPFLICQEIRASGYRLDPYLTRADHRRDAHHSRGTFTFSPLPNPLPQGERGWGSSGAHDFEPIR